MAVALNEIIRQFESEMNDNPMAVINASQQIKDAGFGLNAIEPILRLIEKYPTYDWGNPGHFAHYMEQFSGKGYEEKLDDSISRKPTLNTLFLLYRCANDVETEEELQKYISQFHKILEQSDIDASVREIAEEYLSWLEER